MRYSWNVGAFTNIETHTFTQEINWGGNSGQQHADMMMMMM